MKYLRRAYSDAFEGQLARTILLGLLSVGVGFIAFHNYYGPDRAQLELPGLFIGLVMSLVPLWALFLWSLACAPFRIERDKRVIVEAELADLEKKLGELSLKRRLTAEEQARVSDVLRNADFLPEKIYVLFDPSNAWCADFACDIADAVTAAGVKSLAHQGVVFDRNPRDRGLKIYRGKSKGTVELGDRIHKVFKQLNIHAERRDTETEDLIFFDVCRPDEDSKEN